VHSGVISPALGFNGFDKIATRASPGTISVRSWSRLPASFAVLEARTPVTLPPGRWEARDQAVSNRISSRSMTLLVPARRSAGPHASIQN